MNSEEYRQYVIDLVTQGFFKHDNWWFFQSQHDYRSAFGSIELRIIADELDRRNKCMTSAAEVSHDCSN